MRTVIDLTEDDSPGGAAALPSPTELSRDGDVIVLSLREVELRTTFIQFVALHEAFGAYLVRGTRGELELDLDEERYPMEEHERLRKIIRRITSGEITSQRWGSVQVPADVQRAVLDVVCLESMDPESWRSMQDELFAQDVTIRELREEIAALKDMAKATRRKKGSAT